MLHCYKMNGYNIVIDAYSGSVHAVDEVAFDVISMYENHDTEEVKDYVLKKYADRDDVTNEELDELMK